MGNGGGGFNFSDSPGSVTTPWDDGSDFGDLAWNADLAAVPEPSSMTLLGSQARLSYWARSGDGGSRQPNPW